MTIKSITPERIHVPTIEFSGQWQWLDPAANDVQQLLRNLVRQGGQPVRQIKDLLHGIWLGHPLHPALTDVPVGAWTAGVILDAAGAEQSADRVIALGVAAAVPTALSGLADWTDTEDAPRRVGFVHGFLNTVALGCYLGSLAARRSGARGLGVGLSTVGYTVAFFSAYLGGELTYGKGTGVSRNAWVPEVEDFVAVARASDLPDGQLTKVEFTYYGTRVPLVLLKRGGQVWALSNTCSHWGASLVEGRLVEGDCVQCPWHGSTFRMHDGSVVHGPAANPQPRFETRIREGQVEVRRVPEV